MNALCHPSTGRRLESRRGGQADVLGRQGDSTQVEMRGKEGMVPSIFSSVVLRRSIDVWWELYSNTHSGGSIVCELAELGRDLMNGKLLAERMMVALPPRPLRHQGAAEAVITLNTESSH